MMQSGNNVSEISMMGSMFGWERYLHLSTLLRSALSFTLIKKGATHPFDHRQATRIPCPDCLDAYLIPTVIPPPNIREPKGIVIW